MNQTAKPSSSTPACSTTPQADLGLAEEALRSRVDPPHHVDASPSSTRLEQSTAEQDGSAAQRDLDVLQGQATELADHLRRWEAELARRERSLHDQLRALDLERRQFRLWMQQVQCELDVQREALERLRGATVGDPFEFPR
jgi:hypothetical protein